MRTIVVPAGLLVSSQVQEVVFGVVVVGKAEVSVGGSVEVSRWFG